MKGWDIEDGKYGKKLTLHVAWNDRLLDVFRRKDIQELSLLTPGSFERTSLAFLRQLPWLKCFNLLDMLIEDIDEVHCLSELRSIYMGDYSRKPIDFLKFPFLQNCHMEFCKNRISIAACKDLDYLSLQHYSYKDLSRLTPLTGLTSLGIAQGSLSEITGIEAFSSLSSLDLVLLRNLRDLSPLSKLLSLKELSLEASKGFNNLDALSGLTSLRFLNIANCGEIESLAPLLGCPNLTVLKFSENTNILDGDLRILLQMPHLQNATLANRKHYNMKREDLPTYGRPYPKL